MSARTRQPPARRLEAWLWTGPVGHLLGGAADLTAALGRHALARALRPRALRQRARTPRLRAGPSRRARRL